VRFDVTVRNGHAEFRTTIEGGDALEAFLALCQPGWIVTTKIAGDGQAIPGSDVRKGS
jgi:hypothetical protein